MRSWLLLGLLFLASVPTYAATIAVPPGGDLQAALNQAQPGDRIELAAGVTYTGNFVLPVKVGDASILVTSAASVRLFPAPGVRIDPSYAPALAKIVSPNTSPAMLAPFGSHHFRFENVEITTTYATTAATNYGLVTLGQNLTGLDASTVADLPHDFVFDRVYLHGTPTGNVRRGITMNAASVTVQESYVADIHEVGADSQALAAWNGSGPITITNNYLEAAGENVLFGGADPRIPNAVPSDITVRGNTFFKPLRWKVGDPSYAGIHWSIKNLFELKNAQRVRIEGNLFENSWLDGQVGWAILLTPRNQDGSAPWSVVQDVTIQHNIIRHVGGGVQLLGHDDIHPSLPLKNVTIHNNLWSDINTRLGETGWFMVLNLGVTNLTVTHNTIADHAGGALIAFDGSPSTNFVYNDNLAPHGLYGFKGSGTSIGGNTFPTYIPGATFLHNVLAGALEESWSYPAAYPATTLFPTYAEFAASFMNAAAGDYTLIAGSALRGAATDGTDIGVDMRLLPGASAPVPLPTPMPIPAPTPTPVPVPTPVPTPAPVPSPVTCLDEAGVSFTAPFTITRRTTKPQEKALIASFQAKGWRWVGQSKALKSAIDDVFGCGL